MGLTLVEKILAAHREGSPPQAGDAWRGPFDVALLDEADAAAVHAHVAHAGGRLAQPERVVVIEDRIIMAGAARRFVKDHAIRHHVLLGRGGIAVHDFVDRGFAVPGRVVIGCRPELRGLGAVGCLPVVLDHAGLAQALLTGEVEWRVAPTARITVIGAMGRWAGGRDLMLKILARLGRDALSGRVIEMTGEPIARMEMGDRLEVAALASQLGAITCLLPSDESALTWLRARSVAEVKPQRPDATAMPEQDIELDVGSLEPMVVLPGESFEVRRIPELPEVPLDLVVIGGAAGGRIEQLRAAARLLKEHPLAPGVRLLVIPATQRCLLHAIAEGLVSIFVRAGAVFLPACSGVWEADLPLVGVGERCLATSLVNHPGAHGPVGAEVYLASAVVAAASAVMGRIAHPDEVLRSRREAV